MNKIEKLGLLIFLIGLMGAVFNREDFMFWFSLIPLSIGYWMFVGKDFKDKKR